MPKNEPSADGSSGQVDGRGGKKRRRLKHICAQIRNQMEFYFGDASLHKDRFLKQQIDADPDGYVQLEVFGRFNKLQSITTDMNLVADALSTSTTLQVSDDKLAVKRKIPLSEPKDVDERTIYVECLPTNVDHERLKKVFSTHGTVLYVSLPRYKSTGDFKGFGFVEFETIEAAKKACESAENPDIDPMEKFPKMSKQMRQTAKQVEKTMGKDEVESAFKSTSRKLRRSRSSHSGSSDGESAVPTKRKYSETSEISEIDNLENTAKASSKKSDPKDTTASPDDGVSTKDKCSNNTQDGNNPNIDSEQTVISANVETKPNKDESASASQTISLKRKMENGTQHNEPSVNKQIKVSQDSGTGSLLGKRKVSDTEETGEEPVAKKTAKDSNIETANVTKTEPQEKTSHEPIMKRKAEDDEQDKESLMKRKMTEQSDGVPETKRVRIGETVEIKSNWPKSKNRHKRKPQEKEKPPSKEDLGLYVISKIKWLDLRKEYLTLQKESMKKLKQSLQQSRKPPPPAEKKSRKIEFVPEVIVKVVSNDPLTRKEIKDLCGSVAEIAYVDMKDGQTEGLIRCNDAASAGKLLGVSHRDLTYTLLQGDDEKSYWQKIVADQESKLSQKTRNKKRGSQKIAEKAEKMILNQDRKHKFFDD